MITSVKKFGSFVRTKVDLYDDDIDKRAPSCTDCTGSFQYASSCKIPSNKWMPLPLVSIRQYNRDTSIFEFSLPPGSSTLALPLLGHLLILFPASELDGEDAIRPYTSVSPLNQTGTFELLVKRYDEWGQRESVSTHFLFTKTDHTYRPKGCVSNYIHSLKVGDTALFKHTSQCLKSFEYPSSSIRTITMIAVGVGIAPLIRIIRSALEGDDDRTRYEGTTKTKTSALIRLRFI